MSVIHEERSDRPELRAYLFPLVIGLGMGGLFLRFWYYQVAAAEDLIAEAKRARTTTIEQIAPRGLIQDRFGVSLAGVHREVVLMATPKFALAHPEYISRVASLIGQPVENINQQLNREKWRPYVDTPLKGQITLTAATKIEELGTIDPDFRAAFRVDWMPIRTYSEPNTMAHVIGYVQRPSKTDMDRLKKEGVAPSMFVGKIGVERKYEGVLMGQPGVERLEVDSKRRPIRSIGVESPIPGCRLDLTLSIELQKYAYERLGGYTGAVVAIEPATGEILCLVSKPSYDSSLFLGGITSAEYASLSSDPKKPLFNRALQQHYAPGSTFKIVTAIAAQLAGKFNPHYHAFCAGGFFFKSKSARPIKCLGHHGSISFHDAFVRSCNTYFINLGYRVAGKDFLRKACETVGLGVRPGLDIGGDGKGIVPTAAFYQRYRGEDRMMGGEVANFSIGQGEMSATPLQMAQVAAFVANRGKSYAPHLVRRIIDPAPGKVPTQIQPELLHQMEAPASFWDALQRAMVGVVDYGTARASRIPGVQFGGKTGSAEVRGQRVTNSWFVGVAPMDHPQIAIAVLAENAGHGSDAAAPIASDIVKKYLEILARQKKGASVQGSPQPR